MIAADHVGGRYVPTKYAPKLSGVQLALKAIQDEAAYDLLGKLMKNIVSAPLPFCLASSSPHWLSPEVYWQLFIHSWQLRASLVHVVARGSRLFRSRLADRSLTS